MDQKTVNKANAAVAVSKAIKAIERAIKQGGEDISTNQLLQLQRAKKQLDGTHEDIVEDLRADGFFGEDG